MEYLRRNAKTVAIRAVKRGNHKLLGKLLKNGLIEASTQVTIKPENQSGSSLVCSNLSLTRQEVEVCKCGLDSILCKDYLQRATLLELAASCGEVLCCEVLLKSGADIYGAPDGTTSIVHLLHQLRHVAPSLHHKYTQTLSYLLRFIDPQVYNDRWNELQRNSTGCGLYQLDILYPVNLACALQLPVELEMLLNAGFPLMYNQDSASYYKIDPFVLTVERTTESNASSTKCLNLLLNHPSAIDLDFKPKYKMILLNTVVKKQQVQHLQIMLDKFLDREILGDTYAELIVNAMSQNSGRNNCRKMAELLINANCCDYFTKNTTEQLKKSSHMSVYPSPLTLAIVHHSALVPTLLECGIPIWGQTRKVKPENVSDWLKESKSRRLHKLLKEAEFSDLTLAKEHLDPETFKTFMSYAAHEREHTSSLLFQCRKTIRKQLVHCHAYRIEKLGLPKCFNNYISLK